MTWMSADLHPRRGPVRDVILCPFDVEGIAACPSNVPVSPAVEHRSRITCRHFRLQATPRGTVAACTRPS